MYSSHWSSSRCCRGRRATRAARSRGPSPRAPRRRRRRPGRTDPHPPRPATASAHRAHRGRPRPRSRGRGARSPRHRRRLRGPSRPPSPRWPGNGRRRRRSARIEPAMSNAPKPPIEIPPMATRSGSAPETSMRLRNDLVGHVPAPVAARAVVPVGERRRRGRRRPAPDRRARRVPRTSRRRARVLVAVPPVEEDEQWPAVAVGSLGDDHETGSFRSDRVGVDSETRRTSAPRVSAVTSSPTTTLQIAEANPEYGEDAEDREDATEVLRTPRSQARIPSRAAPSGGGASGGRCPRSGARRGRGA